MVQPIFLSTPQPQITEAQKALQFLTSEIIQRKNQNALQDTLNQLSNIQSAQPQQVSLSDPFTSTPSPAITPQQQEIGPQLPDQRAQQVQRVIPGVSRIDQRNAIRKKAFEVIMKAPASKQEALFKVVDRQFPKIEPQMIKVTDAEGRSLTLPENDPRVLNGEVSLGGLSTKERVAEAKAKQKPSFSVIKYTDKNGVPRSKRVASNNFNNAVSLIEAQGGTIQSKIPTGNTTKNRVIKFTDSNGKPSERLVPENKFNEEVKNIEDAGGIIDQSKSGITISRDADGNPIVQIGGNNSGLQRKTSAKVEDKILAAQASIGRLNRLERKFDKSFINIPGRLKATGIKIKDMLNMDLSPDEQKWFNDFNSFQSDAFENINLYIKEITGAQMSELEANRIRKTLPDPENLSPETFKSKLNAVLERAKEAAARYKWVKENGRILKDSKGNAKEFLDKNGKSVELDDIVDIRGAEIEKQIKTANPQLKQSEVNKRVDEMLLKEF